MNHFLHQYLPTQIFLSEIFYREDTHRSHSTIDFSMGTDPASRRMRRAEQAKMARYASQNDVEEFPPTNGEWELIFDEILNPKKFIKPSPSTPTPSGSSQFQNSSSTDYEYGGMDRVRSWSWIMRRRRRAKNPRYYTQDDFYEYPDTKEEWEAEIQDLRSRTTSMTTPLPQPPPQFPLFPTLPIEIRIKIYNFALAAPRIRHPRKKTYQNQTNKETQRRNQPTGVNYAIGRLSVWPKLLHVCRESREEAIMFYDGIKDDEDGIFKTVENQEPGLMGFGDLKGRKRIKAGDFWWDATVVEERRRTLEDTDI